MSEIIPSIPANWPRLGNRFTRWFGRVVLRLYGWRIKGELPQKTPLVIAGAPHTSNWDFVFAMAAVLAMGIKVNWMGKHTIFVRPFRTLLFALGGIPVNRQAAQGMVEQAVARMKSYPQTIIGLAPEGTRSRVEKWKTGFLRMAHEAQVPVLPIGIDYPSKTFLIGDLFDTSGDHHKDLAILKGFFATCTGRYPEKAG